MSNAELNSQSYLLSKATINNKPIQGDMKLVEASRVNNFWSKSVSSSVVPEATRYFKLADIELPESSIAAFTLYGGYGDGIDQATETKIIMRRSKAGVISLRLIDGMQTVIDELYYVNNIANKYSLYAKLHTLTFEEGFLEYNSSARAVIDPDSVWTTTTGTLPAGATAAQYEGRWILLPLDNGFIPLGAGYIAPMYMVKDDTVRLRGVVKYPSNWSSGAPCTHVPAQYAVKESELVVCANSGASRRADVRYDGYIAPTASDSAGSVNVWFSLSGLEWSIK